MSDKACEDGETRSVWHNMEECTVCGTAVSWELVNHPFFGFQNCERKSAEAAPSERAS